MTTIRKINKNPYICQIVMEEKKPFNFGDYSREYNKQHYKQFKGVIKPDEYEELDKILKDLKMSKADFIRYAFEKIKEDIKKGTIK